MWFMPYILASDCGYLLNSYRVICSAVSTYQARIDPDHGKSTSMHASGQGMKNCMAARCKDAQLEVTLSDHVV